MPEDTLMAAKEVTITFKTSESLAELIGKTAF